MRFLIDAKERKYGLPVPAATAAAGRSRHCCTAGDGATVSADYGAIGIRCAGREVSGTAQRAARIAGNAVFRCAHYHLAGRVGKGHGCQNSSVAVGKGDSRTGCQRGTGQEGVGRGGFKHITAAACNQNTAGIVDGIVVVAAV